VKIAGREFGNFVEESDSDLSDRKKVYTYLLDARRKKYSDRRN